MPYGHDNHHQGGHGGAVTMTPEPVTPTVVNPCGAPAPEPPTCCDLLCFERPRYFCGHLLKDTDLTKAQQYVVEKNKLYHRTLHGYGIVCGLRLTCDASCCGDVRIDEGYAIDDCGNDIVVCDRARFDVITRLKEKGLLIPTTPIDPCDEEKEVSPCVVRQCFYIVVCYQETEYDFSTPLSPGCGPSPKDCEATRVRETYTLDVVDRLPARTSPLDALKERIEHCFSLFADQPFGVTLVEVRRLICRGKESGEGASHYETGDYEKLHELYCRLRGLLLLYLRQHPDQYNCRIESDILEIDIPKIEDANARTSIEKAFCRLIEIAYNHVVSCLLGELAFACPEPVQASCVVLGTVEVEDGCVVRVCNCPRDYVWTFPSFFQVLANQLYGSIACETVDAPEHRHKNHDSDCGCKKGDPTQTCCRTFPIDDCCRFIEFMQSLGGSASDVALSMLNGVSAVQTALKRAFDPTRWDSLPASAFVGRNVADLQLDPNLKGVQVAVVREPLALQPADPLEAFARSFLTTTASRFVLESDKQGRIVAAQPVPELYAQVADVPKLYARVAQLETELSKVKVEMKRGGRVPTGGEGGGSQHTGPKSSKKKSDGGRS